MARQTSLALARVMFAEQAREAALRARTEELRSALLSAVSHDLRTPLAVITGAATTLRDGHALSETARAELLASIVDDARRLERVLTNLLQLTRVETGLEPARAWVPAEELVGAALTRLESALGAVELELDIDPELLLWIDPILFEQVLINLLENALKHGAPPYLVRARRSGDRALIEVADRGTGLPADSTRLFEKFVRASKAPGVGLGLAVVRAIVEAHGGTVSASNRDGGGARFEISLPTAVPEAARSVRPSTRELRV
jgi:two-component system sensor histidine kinase KdpD